MTFHKHFNNFLKLFKEPFSVIELAKAKCLPPALHISNIALLMHPDSDKFQEAFKLVLKGAIIKKILPVITAEEYTNLIIEHECQRDSSNYIEPIPPGHLLPMIATAVAHADTDLLPSDAEASPEQQRMYIVHRDDMQKWLKRENEWPLPQDNLLARWWPDMLSGNNSLSFESETLEHSISNEDAQKVATSGLNATLSAENTFRKEGQMWTLSYGGVTKHFKDLKGFLYISYLLGSPLQEYHVSELVKAAEDPEKEFLSFSSGEVSTQETITNYRKRLSEIKAELEEAKQKGDPLLQKELMEEKDALEKQLMQTVGMGGKLKKNPDEIRRQANAVSMAITRSLKAIGKTHPSIWQHLFNAIKRGVYLSYTPETDISWITTQ